MVINFMVNTWEQGCRSWRRGGAVLSDRTLASVGPDPAGSVRSVDTEKGTASGLDRTLLEVSD